MKLSYREKIGLLIFIVAVVIIIFIAWPIKTIKANIKNHEAEEKRIQVDFDEKNRLIKQIPTIESNIMKVYDESKGLADEFTVHRENFEIDKFVQDILNKPEYKDSDKNKIEITGEFTEGDASAMDLECYYYTPNVVTYPILEAADTNGDMMEKSDKVLYDKVVNALMLEPLEAQQVEGNTATIKLKFTKEALLAFQDELKKLDTGVRIDSVKIEDYKFGLLSEIPEEVGYSEGEVTFSFYTMQQIQEPVFTD